MRIEIHNLEKLNLHVTVSIGYWARKVRNCTLAQKHPYACVSKIFKSRDYNLEIAKTREVRDWNNYDKRTQVVC